MLISIILPIYNIEKYLRQSLDSLVNQTYKDIEIVCVDDGSDDACPSILKEYASRDSRIKVFSQENSGTLIARKVGVKHANGDYITFVDPDDWVELNMCELLVESIRKTNGDVIQFGCLFEDKDFEDTSQIKFFDDHFNKCLTLFSEINSKKDILEEFFIKHSMPYHQWGKIYRRDILKRAFAEIPNCRCVFAEDQGIALVIFNNVDNLHFLDQKLYHYRIGTGISTQKHYTEERYNQCLQSFDMLNAIKIYADKQTENKELFACIVKEIEDSMVETALLLSDFIDGDDDTFAWLDVLLEKCDPKTLAIACIRRTKGTVPVRELEVLRKKNRKHLRQLRLVMILCGILTLITVLCFILIII